MNRSKPNTCSTNSAKTLVEIQPLEEHRKRHMKVRCPRCNSSTIYHCTPVQSISSGLHVRHPLRTYDHCLHHLHHRVAPVPDDCIGCSEGTLRGGADLLRGDAPIANCGGGAAEPWCSGRGAALAFGGTHRGASPIGCCGGCSGRGAAPSR